MAKIPEDHFREKRILEVGSGLGIIGIAAALLGASQVTLTDKACVLDLLKMNVEANVAVSGIRKDVCQVEKLIWGDPHDHTYDTILASDVAYDEREAFALVSTLVDTSSNDTNIYVAIPEREDAAAFWNLVKRNFTVTILWKQRWEPHQSEVHVCLLKKCNSYLLRPPKFTDGRTI
eukprot:gene16679-19815_t